MTRPSGWDVVDQGDDPVKGDPATLRTMAREYQRMSDEGRQTIENVEAAQRVFAQQFPWSSTVEYRRAWAETTGHWVVFWNSASYYATGSPFDAIVGNGPLIVPKDGSEPFTFGSGEDWRTTLEARGEMVMCVVDPGGPNWEPPAGAEWI